MTTWGKRKRGKKRTRIDEVLYRKAVLAYVSMRQRDDILHPMTDELFSGAWVKMVEWGSVEGRKEDAPRLVCTRFMKLIGIEMAGGADGSGDGVRKGTRAGACGK